MTNSQQIAQNISTLIINQPPAEIQTLISAKNFSPKLEIASKSITNIVY
jgi:hypothetical protein